MAGSRLKTNIALLSSTTHDPPTTHPPSPQLLHSPDVVQSRRCSISPSSQTTQVQRSKCAVQSSPLIRPLPSSSRAQITTRLARHRVVRATDVAIIPIPPNPAGSPPVPQ
ncbi:hypothetical protein WOLCODRAFT_28935, partial [Wolfiporia cocos MD-104 SS10]